MFALNKRQFNIKNFITYAALCIFVIAAFLIMFLSNITPSIALEQELRCGMVEHVHTDDCYNEDFLICEKTAHTHDGNCYIVLLKENDINGILTLLSNTSQHSLENAITDVMSTAFNFNENLNSNDDENVLTKNTVEQLNDTITAQNDIPDITLNENINTFAAVSLDNTDTNNTSNNVAVLNVEESTSKNNNTANIMVYLDNKWTCIGTLPFTLQENGSSWFQKQYNAVVQTSDLVNLINSKLNTNFTHSSFSISASSNQNNNYSVSDLSVGSQTTIISYKKNESNSKSAKYVRIINVGGSQNSTSLAFYTVKFVYPNGDTTSQYVQRGSTVVLPGGNYEWTYNNTTYDAGEAVTITGTRTFTAEYVGPLTFVSINYDINFPSISDATVQTTPTLSGLTTGSATDGFSEGASATVRNVSSNSVKAKVKNNSTNLSRIVQFKGWKIQGTDIILQPNTTLVWDELLKYQDDAEFTLVGVWETDPLITATFFVKLDSVAVDTEGNITGQDQTLFTKELFATYVGGVDTSLSTSVLDDYNIADTTSDNSFGADQKIRALYGEKSSGIWLFDFPSDDSVFEQLKSYAEGSKLSVDGQLVSPSDLNHQEYAIRWYVLKVQSDAWHIDGKLVRKEGLIHVYKTFAGNKELINEAKSDFYIDATDVTLDTNFVLNLSNHKTYDAATDTYMWEITNVDYGEEWIIEEHPHKFTDPTIDFGVYSEYTVVDAHGDQSVTSSGTSLSVRGMTYALDEGTDEVLRAKFTNIYNKSNSIVIKKQDSLTGVSIGGATFQLLQNGKPLNFDYNSNSESYSYNPNGAHTVLQGTQNGYFEISIDKFSYDLGNVVVREISPPDGYSPIGDIEIGYTNQDGDIGIISGNSELIKYFNGILIVGNSTDTMTVTANKKWECPQNEWQEVTVQLLANGKLATTIISGVVPEVTLNNANAWTHTWTNLPVYVNGEKIVWSIKEIKIGNEKLKADGTFVNWIASYDLPISSTDENGKEVITLGVNNTTKRVMLRLTKTDLSKTKTLAGASFLLEVVDNNGNLLPNEVVKTATTGENGSLIFDNLKSAVRYRLSETTAPDGYIKIAEYIYFTINEDGSVSVEDNYYAEAGGNAYNIVVRNAEAVPLPSSGGIGNCMFYALGLILMITAGIYISILHKRRCSY